MNTRYRKQAYESALPCYLTYLPISLLVTDTVAAAATKQQLRQRFLTPSDVVIRSIFAMIESVRHVKRAREKLLTPTGSLHIVYWLFSPAAVHHYQSTYPARKRWPLGSKGWDAMNIDIQPLVSR